MQAPDPFEEATVLFLEDSQMHQDLFEGWLSPVSTRFAMTPGDVPKQFDSTVTVTCLSEPLIGEREEEIRKFILTRNPFCQLILLLPRSSFVTPYEDDYDICLIRPLFEDALQEAIETGLKHSVYSSLLHEFYSLNAYFQSQARADGSKETETGPSFSQVRIRFQEVQTQLNQLQAWLSQDDIMSIMQSLELHKKYLTTPTEEADTAASKYHPRRCPNCKLAWGIDHGNELGGGVEPVGAHVWKCTRCGEIVHGMSQGNRRINR